MNEATVRQPTPTSGGEDVTSKVMADLEERARIGALKYGIRLQTKNGRNALVDAYQEVLDLACYLKQRLMEESSEPKCDEPRVNGRNLPALGYLTR